VPQRRVCIAIVTYNSGRYIRRCLDAVLQQEGVHIEVVVVDNASTDNTCEILKEFKGRIRKFLNGRNLGFAEAQNQAIRSSRAEWVLTLNPDVLLLPGFLRMLVDAGETDPGAGAVCGKLLSIGPDFRPLPEARIDSTGIFFTPAMRHFDRGWHEPDIQCFQNMEYVFGASAAAALFRRRMIDDIAVEGSFFDPDFFAYREDADVAWRAQLMGWRCIYTPAAVAYHVRSVTPGNRRSVPATINMHSVKNRFLMRIKNATPGLYRRYWLPMTLRDILVLGGSMFWEPTSLPAFWRLGGCMRRAWRQRRTIMSRKKVSDEVIAQWFSFEPAAQPIHETPASIPARHLLEPAVTLAGRTT
jgi:GT2 family glycosyltransferase